MKRLTLFLATAMLVWSLTACGCTAKQVGEQGQAEQNGQTDSAIVDGNNATNGTNSSDVNDAMNGDSGTAQPDDNLSGNIGDAVTDGIDDMAGAAENAGDALMGNNSGADKNQNTTGGVSYEQMLRNARVHDRDGDLTDHENSVSSMF